jgi:pyruvate dehydrogenase (quinone)
MDACVYNCRVMGAAHVQNVVELACRSAMAYRGGGACDRPCRSPIAALKSAQRSERNVPDHVSELMARSAQPASEAQIASAVAILNAGSKTVILAGSCAEA